jgi:hypothetical protein
MLHSCARILARILAASSAACFLLWLTGRLCNDRWHLTQYLYWMPTPLVLACMLLASLCIALLARLLPPARPKVRTRLVLWGLNITVLLSLLAEWNVTRYLLPVEAPSKSSPLRIVAWNPAIDFMDDFATRVVALNPAIIAITNRPAYTDWVALQDQVGGTRSMARFSHVSLVSRYRILRWGGTRLGITDARKRTTRWAGGGEVSQDQGEALFVELDTSAVLGRNLMLWMIDIPSDPNLCRDTVFRQARATLDGFSGPSYTRSPLNLDVRDEPGTTPPGFPAADVMIGDFNTPRGSHSITHVTGTLRHAYDLAGRGWCPTWRRDYPLIAIDQCFLAPWLGAVGYAAPDMGAGWHRAQVIDVLSLPAN